MHDPFELPPAVQRLMEASLRSEGETSVALREAVADRAASLAGASRTGGPIPDELVSLVEKVAQHAYKVTDEDYAALAEAGYSEDQLFELTVCAALGASFARMERGLDALRRAGA